MKGVVKWTNSDVWQNPTVFNSKVLIFFKHIHSYGCNSSFTSPRMGWPMVSTFTFFNVQPLASSFSVTSYPVPTLWLSIDLIGKINAFSHNFFSCKRISSVGSTTRHLRGFQCQFALQTSWSRIYLSFLCLF